MRVVVYDNGSTDGTPELCRERFGEQIVYRRWEENRGRHANMTRAFTESDADHLIMVFDDEELLPGAIAAMLGRAADDPAAAFVAGRFLYRDADGTTMRESSLQAPVDFRPPARMAGDDFIRMAYRSGAWTWVCSVLFNRTVVGTTWCSSGTRRATTPDCCCAPRCSGPILYLDRATTTKTDGNLGESIRDGLTEAETLEARNVIRLSGILGFRHTLEKFLFFEANDHFTAKERRAMLHDLDNFAPRCSAIVSPMSARSAARRRSARSCASPSTWFTASAPGHGSSAGAPDRAGRDEVRRAVGQRCLPRRGRAAGGRPRVLRPGLVRARSCQDHGCEGVIAQMNLSTNLRAGTIRGLHVQAPPHGEAKFFRCIAGRSFHVVVDVRPDSPTYGRVGRASSSPPIVSTRCTSPRTAPRATRRSRTAPSSSTASRRRTPPAPRRASAGTIPPSGSTGRSPTE